MGILGFIFNLITTFRNYLYDKYILRINRVKDLRVVCVGNITVGGTGKTPAVQYFAEKYKSLGYNVAVVSRGYKGKRKKDPFLVRDNKTIFGTTKEAGDEAYLHSLKLKIPVIVSRNRFEGCLMAKRVLDADLVILDDGFQHRKLWRDKNIVLIDATNPFGYEKLLPDGTLRESVKGLNRADEIIITKSDLVDDLALANIKERLTVYNKPISMATHGPTKLYGYNGKDMKLDKVKDKNVLIFSALANPHQFEETIKKLNPKEISTIEFSDHHEFNKRDIDKIIAKSNDINADMVICTEKDFVKLKDIYEIPKLHVLAIEFNILEDNICWKF